MRDGARSLAVLRSSVHFYCLTTCTYINVAATVKNCERRARAGKRGKYIREVHLQRLIKQPRNTIYRAIHDHSTEGLSRLLILRCTIETATREVLYNVPSTLNDKSTILHFRNMPLRHERKNI